MASSGILLLDKPRGLSSNAALQRVRVQFDGEKAGHVGSLDPLATGMLPICLGEATKVAGEILAVERAPRAIEVLHLRLLGLAPPALELEVLCSKGTYVRVLAEDIAAALDTLGHVSVLRREYVEPFEHEPMQTLEALGQTRARGEWPSLLPPDAALGHLPAVRLGPEEARRVRQGQPAGAADAPRGVRVRLYDAKGFFGLGLTDASGTVQPRRLLRSESAPTDAP